LASASLTALIVFFNLARGLVFSANEGKELQQQNSQPFVGEDAVVTAIENPADKESSAKQNTQDYVALAAAALNVFVGIATAHMVSGGISLKSAFCVVVFQMMVQLLIVPIIVGHTFHLLKRMDDGAKDKIGSLPIAMSSNCEWMFGDAASVAFGFNELAHLNPFRWSGPTSFEKAIYDLEDVLKVGSRSILAKVPAGIQTKSRRFETTEEAIAYLKKKRSS